MKIEVSFIIQDDFLPKLKAFLSDAITITKKQVGCNVDGCPNGHHAKGYCQKHYRKWKNYGDPLYESAVEDKGCLTEGCTGLHYAKGYCYNCYMSFKNTVQNTKKERAEWKRIQTICSDSGHGLYHRYGGRGVTVCEEWAKDFTTFYEDMGDQPSSGAVIDCDSGVFNKDNCRWVTPEEFQENNKRRASERYKGMD